MCIAFGSDHAATALKQELIAFAQSLGHITQDFDQPGDYPVVAKNVATAVAAGSCGLGLLLCGTGVGISIAANKVHGIRAVCCSEPYSAMLSRQHNNSNILCMGARVVGPELAKMIFNAWLEAQFEGGRHATRVDMIHAMEH